MKLFRPAWDSENWEEAVKAVAKIRNEAELARVAKEARSGEAREAAVKRLTDQRLLVDIARNDKEYSYVRQAATARLTDQSILADIAQNDEDCGVRQAATGRLTDQSILVDIAQNSEYGNVRQAAVERLTDPGILAAIARNDNEYISVRIAASHRLVTYDLEEDLLTYIIHTLGDILKYSGKKWQKEEAGEALLSWYRRYRKDKQGEEIRMYEGKYGYSDHRDEYRDYHTEEDDYYTHICNPTTIDVYTDEHTDKHRDSLYSFYPEEA